MLSKQKILDFMTIFHYKIFFLIIEIVCFMKKVFYRKEKLPSNSLPTDNHCLHFVIFPVSLFSLHIFTDTRSPQYLDLCSGLGT